MEHTTDITSINELKLELPFQRVHRTWDLKVAHWVSNSASPPLTALYATLLVSFIIATPMGWFWAATNIIVGILLPVVFVLWLQHRGIISDFEIYYRKQRTLPYLFMIGCSFAALLAMCLGSAPRLYCVLVATGLVQTVLMFIVNLRWKISGHTAAMASFTVVASLLAGVFAAPAWIALPVVAWSRIHMHKHTLAQTIAGATLSILLFSASFYLFL